MASSQGVLTGYLPHVLRVGSLGKTFASMGAQLRPGPSVFKMVLAIARMNAGCLNEREDFPVVLCYMGPRVAVWL